MSRGAGSSMVEAIWFGEPGSTSFGMFHRPQGAVRAGIVICPPLGLEGISAHATLRTLAERLVAQHFAVLRLDYPGTGDAGDVRNTDGHLHSWVSSVDGALGLLADAGAPRLAVVGMRMGALLAACTHAVEPLAAAVLWDPPVSGRAFLREQRALSMLSHGASSAGTGDLEAPGFVYGADTVAEMHRLAYPAKPVASRVLVLTRPGASAPALGDAWSPHLEHDVADGQAALLNVNSENSVIPAGTAARIARWVDSVLPATNQVSGKTGDQLELPPVGRLAHDQGGRRIVERACHLGPSKLFAIACEPDGPVNGPTVVFLNVAAEPHIGPARQWVTLSRSLAAAGRRAVRVDLSGLGESPCRQGAAPGIYLSADAIDDATDTARALSAEDPTDVVFVGLCSGASMAIEAALALRARGVCVINPPFQYAPPEWRRGARGVDPRRRAWYPRRGLFRYVDNRPRWHFLRAAVPGWVWHLLDLTGLQAAPTRGLAALVGQGTGVVMVCARADLAPYEQMAPWALRRLRGNRAFEVSVIPGLDHSQLIRGPRQAASELIEDHLLADPRMGVRGQYRAVR